jgi:putative nucleotidyltransferase with HDIG domain
MTETYSKENALGARLREGWQRVSGALFRALIALLAAGAIYAMMIDTVITPRRHTVTVGAVATEDVFASRTMEDSAQTDAKRQEARDAVGDSYSEDSAVTQKIISTLITCFDQMQQVRVDGESERSAMAQRAALGGVSETGYSSSFLEACNEKIQAVTLSEQSLIGLLDMAQRDFDSMKDAALQQVDAALKNGIKEDQLTDQLAFINRALRSDDTALSEDAQRIAGEVVAAIVQPNLFVDKEATEAAKEQAAQKVEPVMIMAGQSIMRKGDVVTQSQYQLLSALGLLEEERNDMPLYWGIGLMIFIVFAISGMYLVLFERSLWDDLRRYALLVMVALLTTALCWVGRKISYQVMPMAVAAMLYAMLLNRRVAYLMTAMLSILAGMLAGEPGVPLSANALPVMAATLLAGTLSINMLTSSAQRGTVMLCGTAVSAVCLLVFGVTQMMGAELEDFVQNQLFPIAMYCLGNGLGSAIIVLGSFPLWEGMFRLVTPMKLLELTNPNQPLLRQLLLEAPGTYHHSVVVSNLAESAAEAVGANPMLARCGALYHDIGKLRRPNFFKENQVGNENPHDQIDAALSAKILVSHVLDGQELARKFHLPQEVIDIIATHHGDTLAAYFYIKAQKEAEDPATVDEADFRYPGPVPSTKEEAIIMLADSVEAAVRSMPKHTPQSMEEMVRRIIKGKREDGQLDYCDLTFGQLEVITRVFLSVLGGIYHERIQYPTLEKENKA